MIITTIVSTILSRHSTLCLCLLCLILSFHLPVHSQSVLTASDAVASVNSIVSVTITGTVQNSEAPLILALEYDRVMLEPRSVTAGAVFACASPQMVSTPITGTKKGHLEISCPTIASAGENIVLCTVNFLILAGDTSFASVLPISLIQNGIPMAITPKTGIITISGNTVKKIATSTLGMPFPNPFPYSTKIPYTLGEKTPVRFSLFTLTGHLIQEFPEFEQDAGTYSFDFVPEINTIGTAPYVLRMDTRSGSSNITILLTKN